LLELLPYIFGRSRRGAFIAGILGIIISDIIAALGIAARPVSTTIGGAGILDAAVISGVIAVGLCEIVGETGEKLMGGSWAKRKEDKSSMASSLTENKSSREEGEHREEEQ